MPLTWPKTRRMGNGAAAALVSGRGIITAAILALATLALFSLLPNLDLAAAAVFYDGHNHFIGQTAAGETLRRIFSAIPFLIVAVMLGLFAARRLGAAGLWAPSGRGTVFLLVSLALGPGLLVNVVLKDHSHRPRPVQTAAFEGPLPFRPVATFDGACDRNCSFVSGEGAAAFWTLAPALLAPATLQPLALAAALCFGTVVSLLRMAFGGHYLSDTIMAALLTWIVVAASFRAVMRRPPSDRNVPFGR